MPHFLHSRRDQTTEMEGYHTASQEGKIYWKCNLKIPCNYNGIQKDRLINGSPFWQKNLHQIWLGFCEKV